MTDKQRTYHDKLAPMTRAYQEKLSTMTAQQKRITLAEQVMGWTIVKGDEDSRFPCFDPECNQIYMDYAGLCGDESYVRPWNPLESVGDAMEVAMKFGNITIRRPFTPQTEFRVGLSNSEFQSFVERTSLCEAIVDAALLSKILSA